MMYTHVHFWYPTVSFNYFVVLYEDIHTYIYIFVSYYTYWYQTCRENSLDLQHTTLCERLSSVQPPVLKYHAPSFTGTLSCTRPRLGRSS